jgi:hypothetical protein
MAMPQRTQARLRRASKGSDRHSPVAASRYSRTLVPSGRVITVPVIQMCVVDLSVCGAARSA